MKVYYINTEDLTPTETDYSEFTYTDSPSDSVTYYVISSSYKTKDLCKIKALLEREEKSLLYHNMLSLSRLHEIKIESIFIERIKRLIRIKQPKPKSSLKARLYK